MKSDYSFDPKNYERELISIVVKLLELNREELDEEKFKQKTEKILKKHPKDGNQLFRRDQLLKGIEYMQDTRNSDVETRNTINNHIDELAALSSRLKMKPMRTESGVTTVTVLTKPFACPGKCVFCPNDVRMPKSYIATEPGAQRALQNRFSPYLQVWNRLQALKNIGHPTQKIELLILGGTWSYYPEKYQIWFISECFRAMNDFGQEAMSSEQGANTKKLTAQGSKHIAYKSDDSGFLYEGEKIKIKQYLESDWNEDLRNKVGDLPYNTLIKTDEFKKEFAEFICSEESALPPQLAWEELKKLHEINSNSETRCVGLVLETRPDSITPRETLRMRKLGATKIQLGIQTLNDRISEMNKRGEGMKETSRAFQLLRAAGFKIHAHMMPNLYGSTTEIDKQVYKDLFTLLEYKPDEVKIYPTSTIKFTELHELYEKGEYKPYSTEELIDIISFMVENTPEYCRLTRIIRDIPSTEIEAGNKTTNLREIVEWKLKKEGRANPNIRAREIRNDKVKMQDLSLNILEYETAWTNEYFLQYVTKERRIAGFLRLSLPKTSPASTLVSASSPEKTAAPVFEKSKNLLLEETQNAEQRISREGEVLNPVTPELNNCAIIREVHVYGPALDLEKNSKGEAQHLGLGTLLIEKAKEISKHQGFEKLAVISSIGTREYYKKRGFELVENYQIADLNTNI